MNEKAINKEEQTEKFGALSLLKKIFAERDATLELMEDGRMGFCYGYDDNQDEHFIVEADDEHVNIRLIDYCWHEVSIWDAEEVVRIQARANQFNTFARCKVVYHYDDNDRMLLSTLLTCPLYPEIPDVNYYFIAQLRSMIEAHDFILNMQESPQTSDSDSDHETDNSNLSVTDKEGGKV